MTVVSHTPKPRAIATPTPIRFADGVATIRSEAGEWTLRPADDGCVPGPVRSGAKKDVRIPKRKSEQRREDEISEGRRDRNGHAGADGLQHEFTLDNPSSEPCYGGNSLVTIALPVSGLPVQFTCAPEYIVRATQNVALQTLSYDSVTRIGGVSCTVNETELRCYNSDSHGFTLSKASFTTY